KVINVEMENVSTVRLFDVSGKLLKEVNSASIYTIDVTDLTPGMYMIESAEGAKAKFIKE
ncbi:MAG: T9SS type A sorting domain-containing protein, partial [Flavobacteriales bacterium]